ncbi:MAG: hypothetical protein GWP19_03970 [Planctomycetia bacterium]|nr:hypothetical protein [Planctomycetia bacterium]
MNILRLLPVIFSFSILSAHFSRAGLPILSVLCLLMLFLLFIKRVWVARLIQIILILGSIEWIRSVFYYVNQRQTIGEPYLRLIIIIGVVALFTGLSTLVFRNKALKERYKL